MYAPGSHGGMMQAGRWHLELTSHRMLIGGPLQSRTCEDCDHIFDCCSACFCLATAKHNTH